MKRTTSILTAIAFGALSWAASESRATTYIRLDDAALAQQSPVIVSGRIVDLVPAGRGRLPAVEYHLDIDQVVKGAAMAKGDRLRVQLPGGVRSDGIGLQIFGMPQFAVGEEVLFFLRRQDGGVYVPQQLMLGAFRVSAEQNGKVARRELGGALELPPTDAKGAAAETSGERPRDAAKFIAWLSELDRGRLHPPDYFLPAAKTPAVAKFATIRSSTEPLPLGCGSDGGHEVRWFGFGELDETWFSSSRTLPSLDGGGIDQLRMALRSWSNDPNTTVSYFYGGSASTSGGFLGPDGFNTLLFEDPNGTLPGSFDGAGVLALAGPWFSCIPRPFRGKLFHPAVEADVILQDGLDLLVRRSRDPAAAIAELLGHEIGHTLGLAHPPVEDALMFGNLHDDGRGVAFAVDDLAGLYYLYGDPAVTLPRPQRPTELVAEATSPTTIQLRWQDRSTTESNFRIERRAGGSFRTIGTTNAGQTSYTDSGRVAQTPYTYRVVAQNASGASGYSATAVATTPADQRPVAPSNLRLAPLTGRKLRLQWQDNSDDENGFRLEVRSNGPWIEIPAVLPVDTEAVDLSGLEPATEYSFRVRAANAFGGSPPSREATASTLENDPLCTVDNTHLCLSGGRFEASLDYANHHAGFTQGSGTARPDSDPSGHFWLFDSELPDLTVRVVDGRSFNGRFWVLTGGLTDVETTLTVRDTVTGLERTYLSPAGSSCGVSDTAGFPAAPTQTAARKTVIEVSQLTVEPHNPTPKKTAAKSTAGTCSTTNSSLCLLDGRFAVEVEYTNQFAGNSSGSGQSVRLDRGAGYFWYFRLDFPELVVKMIDGRSNNGHFWLFWDSLSSLGYRLTVTDTVTGDRRIYERGPENTCGGADTTAFTGDDASAEPAG